MTTLHVGTRDAERLIDLLPTASVTVFRDGDSWEEWGERINHLTPASQLDPHNEDQQRMAHHPEHIVIRTREWNTDSVHLLRDIAWILSEGPDLLIPMMYLNQPGVLAVITGDAEWSEREYYTLVDNQARHRALAACTHPEHRLLPVPNPAGRFARVYCRDCHIEFTPATEGA